jgi:hypothetical protein
MGTCFVVVPMPKPKNIFQLTPILIIYFQKYFFIKKIGFDSSFSLTPKSK